MPEVNTKFIANPAFGVTSVAGQALTLEIASRTSGGNHVGYKCLYFDNALYSTVDQGLTSVAPQCSFTDPSSGNTLPGKLFFLAFVRKNPIHVKKMNVRASDYKTLPASIEIQTPNVFTGQMDRQIVNVTADTNMYQNQNNIVTLDCDIYLCRESIVVFNASFTSASAVPLFIDITFDKYLSVEKALVENYQLLVTDAGLASAINAEIEQVNAKTADIVKRPAVMQPTMMAANISPWRPVIGGSAQPRLTKGDNI